MILCFTCVFSVAFVCGFVVVFGFCLGCVCWIMIDCFGVAWVYLMLLLGFRRFVLICLSVLRLFCYNCWFFVWSWFSCCTFALRLCCCLVVVWVGAYCFLIVGCCLNTWVICFAVLWFNFDYCSVA